MYLIIGQAGAGKSTLGTRLISEGFLVFDLDLVISERIGSSPSQIISKQGLKEFRNLEATIFSELIRDFADKHAILIAGGGIVDLERNLELINKTKILLVKRGLFSTLKTLNGDYRGYKPWVFLFKRLRRAQIYRKIEKKGSDKLISLNANDINANYSELLTFLEARH